LSRQIWGDIKLAKKEKHMDQILTGRPAQVYEIIRRFIERQGYSPSYAEIAEQLNLPNASNIYRIVNKLEDLGFVTRPMGKQRRMHRGIKVTRKYPGDLSDVELPADKATPSDPISVAQTPAPYKPDDVFV
jgi:SOS-response transcriptional repressor LexA